MELHCHIYFGVAFLSVSLSWVLGDCGNLDLGMKSGTISDNKTTASSELNVNTPPKNGRLNYTAGSSWCASTSDSNPYLQIDLQALHIICAVSTQGNSQGDQWVETYTLQSSKDGKTWINYKKDGRVKTLTGNNNRDTENKNIVYGVLARWIRFIGKTKHNRFCMRTEVFGVRLKPENLAAGKLTRQSSTYNNNYTTGESYKAVDGNPDTNFNNGHCSHTLRDKPSWWRVYLGPKEVPVFEVRIVNRIWKSLFPERNVNYKITLGNYPNVKMNRQCHGEYSFIDFVASAVCYHKLLKTGRYVGIMTTKQQFLQLCEVEIYSLENLAFNKKTSQSTTAHNGFSSNAVDGNLNTNYHDLSCTHTDLEPKPWWRVDLGQVEPVTEIYIVNRGDCCGARLNPFEIRVGTNSFKGGYTNPKCGDGDYSILQGQGESFFCRPILYGRYVIIRNTNNQLTLCEVEVYSARRACQIQRVGVASSNAYPNDCFSASSSAALKQPSNGRLNGPGAWSPRSDSMVNEYLQINLKYEFYICAVATQGNPNFFHWTTKYKLILSKDNANWITYQESGTDKVFNGNNGRNDIVKNNLVEIAIARFVRFQPTAFSTRIALRVELYGVYNPAVPSKAPINFIVTTVSSTSIFASWELAPEDSRTGRITGFKLFYKKKGSDESANILIINSGSTLAKNVTGLNKFTKYEFQVLAFTSFGNGPKSSVNFTRTNEDVPSKAPIGFKVDAISFTTIIASWNLPPADSRNGIITGFKLFYKKKDSNDPPTMINIKDEDKRIMIVSGLAKNGEYEFQVLAYTSVGDGPKSSVKVLLNKDGDDGGADGGADGDSIKSILTIVSSIAGSVVIVILVVIGVRYGTIRKIRAPKRIKKNIQILHHYEIPPIRTEFVEELGRGAFGKVHKAKLKDGLEYFKVEEVSVYTTNRKKNIVAVKQLHENANEQQEKELLDEIECMKRVGKHPNVVSFIGCWTKTKPLLLITEYIPHGDLLHWLRGKRCQITTSSAKKATKDNELYANTRTQSTTADQGGETHEKKAEMLVENAAPSEILHTQNMKKQEQAACDGIDQCEIEMAVLSSSDQKRGASVKSIDDECDEDCESFDPSDLITFAWQIARGMSYLSSKDLVHRDLAARNILMGHGKKLKIGDFGLMREMYHEIYEVNSQKKLPIKWMAPESIYEQIFTSKSDVWSYGVAMWEIGTLGGSPYPLLNNKDLMRLLRTDYRMEKPDLCSENFYSLMMDCWKQDPDERPSFPELFERLEQIMLQNVEYFDFDRIDKSKDYYQVQE